MRETVLVDYRVFFHPNNYPRTAVALLPVVKQIQGHIAGARPPSSLRYVPSFLSQEEFSIFFPRRLAANVCLPTLLGVLSAVDAFFACLQINSKSLQGGNRTQGPTLVVFEGNHWTTGATGNAN